MKILIAEDDPISRCVLEANLLEWGYEVMVASDGGEEFIFCLPGTGGLQSQSAAEGDEW